MQAVDAHGSPAYSCAKDGAALEPAPDAVGVLRCPRCGHRTDAPGAGVLDDGFDVVHRQWGLRGDPHVWQALRSAVGAEPTPESAELVRAALVAGLRRVADVDVDGDPRPVRREEFAHGGMSSGMVDVGWWHDKGVPLLVQRALARRAATSAGAARWRSLLATVLVWMLLSAIPLALLGGGAWLLYQRAVGTPAQATVLACETSANWVRYSPRVSEQCVAEWTLDGRTVVGGYNGGSGSDVGKTVDVTVRGETAYSRSLALPLLLIALGLPLPALVLVARVRGSRGREAPRSGEDDGARPR